MSLFARRRAARLAKAHSIEDLRVLAQHALPTMVFDFLDGAAQTESTARANRRGFDSIGVLPGPLKDVSDRSTRVDLFGRTARMPVIIGPTGFNAILWPEGDIALARAATQFGIPFVMSHGANVSMARLRADRDAAHWFQLYLPKERDRWPALITAIGNAGFQALEVTLDTAVPGRRLRDMHNEFGVPLRWTVSKIAQVLARPTWARQMWAQGIPKPVIIQDALADGARHATPSELMATQVNPSVTWEDLKRVRDLWKGPLIAKGLLNPRDIEQAAAAGYDGVVLSNHGGRQLDGSVSSITMLSECVLVARGRLAVLLDSGVRSGTDILKALALGATAVQIGRAALYGLAAGGHAGVTRALSILLAELDLAMALSGVTSIADVRAVEIRSVGHS